MRIRRKKLPEFYFEWGKPEVLYGPWMSLPYTGGVLCIGVHSELLDDENLIKYPPVDYSNYPGDTWIERYHNMNMYEDINHIDGTAVHAVIYREVLEYLIEQKENLE